MYSGFGRRFLAFWIDRIILSGIIYLICITINIPSNEAYIYSGINPYQIYGNASNTNAQYVWIFVILLPWLYYAVFESSILKATPGKIVLGMKVTDINEKGISFGTASIRYFGKFLSAAIFGIGFIMAAFTQKKQALHDTLAKTVVVNK